MGKIKYKEGCQIGPYHHILIKRLYKTTSGHWICEFECGWCHNIQTHFIANIEHLVRENHELVSCGCQDDRLYQEKIERIKNLDKKLVQKGAKQARENDSPYKIGTK